MKWIREILAKLKWYLEQPAFKPWRKWIVFVFGSTILIIGIVMIVLPGPAFIVIPISLAVLGTEFVWAKKLLDRIKKETTRIKGALKGPSKRGIDF